MYRAVPNLPDFLEIEHRMIEFWQEIDAFKKLQAKVASGEKWSFQDGPITANNPMGVHHAWGRSYKDMFQRYHAMNGKAQRFQNGFDCQGLWVEVEVEKGHNFKTRKEILDYGIASFNRDCKERVLTYAARQTEQSIRLGYWSEWDNPKTLLVLRDALHRGDDEVTITTAKGNCVTGSPENLIGRLGTLEFGGSYFTLSDENNYTIWAFLKKCHEDGFIYRGTDVMPWCCRCGTGISQMEVTEGRQIVSHPSIFVRFPIRGRKKEALLVWTTTPWTLTSNVAAAVNPRMEYLKVRHGDWVYYLGKETFNRERVESVEIRGKRQTRRLDPLESILRKSADVSVLEEVPGSDLLGLEYDGPFDHLPSQQQMGGVTPHETDIGTGKTGVSCHRVIPWEDVTYEEGTGIVHIAPGCGAEDFALGREHDLVIIAPLTPNGEYVEGFGRYTGQMVLKVADSVVEDLENRNLLVALESYVHVYPHCWRCKEELVFRLVDEWFIRMDWRDRIQKVVPDIQWIPEEGRAQELDWLKNMGDWMISKKRFWGLSLPIWVCGECEGFTVVGSKEELRDLAIEGWADFEGHSPHRPYVDMVKIACEGCGGKASRIEDVGNPWLDAGIVPFSTAGYSSDREYWQQWFPADFVVECFPGQFRNWFYSLLAMSAMMDGRAPFRTLLGHALVRDARGEEMHKSSGNAIAFDDAAEHFGAEVMRYIFAAQNPAHNLNFPDLHSGKDVRSTLDGEVRRRLLTFWNVYAFFVTYATTDHWAPNGEEFDLENVTELDKWILSRLQNFAKEAHRAFLSFKVYHLIEGFERFDDELSNWYLRRSRRRFWTPGFEKDKEAAYSTLHRVLVTTVRLLAPVLPFLTEDIYQNIVRTLDQEAPASVHLTDYPHADESLINPDLEAKIDCVIRTKNLALRLRRKANIRVRQPLGTLILRPRNETDREVLEDPHFADQVLDECNIKELKIIEDENTLVTHTVELNFKAVGPRYGKLVKSIATHLERTDPVEIHRIVTNDQKYAFHVGSLQVELSDEDVEFSLSGPDNLEFILESGTFAAIDKKLTKELIREGIARDFNRHAQERRRACGLQVSDRVTVKYVAPDHIASALDEYDDMLRSELLAERIDRVFTLEGGTVRIGGEIVALEVTMASIPPTP